LATLASPQLPLDRRYRYFADEAALHRALSAWRPDFVEASSPWSSASMVARWGASVPRALVMHADPLSAYAYRWFGGLADIATIDRGFDRFWQHLRRLDQAFDCVISASANLTARLLAGGVRGATTIEMGVEPGIFSPNHRDPTLRARLLAACGLDSDAMLLLGVGRYSPEKRWGMVIDAALSAGTQTPTGLVLVGDGRIRRALIARTAGSPHVVVGAPIRDRRVLAATMASADALVHGCEAETFCMAAAEACASGLPIIVPDRGGAADHVRHPPSRHYRAADAVSLRDAIVALADEKPAFMPFPPEQRVRTMDQHFDRLFAVYAASATPLRRAA
jgi:alpha-1,6-mannosyltransferase